MSKDLYKKYWDDLNLKVGEYVTVSASLNSQKYFHGVSPAVMLDAYESCREATGVIVDLVKYVNIIVKTDDGDLVRVRDPGSSGDFFVERVKRLDKYNKYWDDSNVSIGDWVYVTSATGDGSYSLEVRGEVVAIQKYVALLVRTPLNQIVRVEDKREHGDFYIYVIRSFQSGMGKAGSDPDQFEEHTQEDLDLIHDLYKLINE